MITWYLWRNACQMRLISVWPFAQRSWASTNFWESSTCAAYWWCWWYNPTVVGQSATACLTSSHFDDFIDWSQGVPGWPRRLYDMDYHGNGWPSFHQMWVKISKLTVKLKFKCRNLWKYFEINFRVIHRLVRDLYSQKREKLLLMIIMINVLIILLI